MNLADYPHVVNPNTNLKRCPYCGNRTAATVCNLCGKTMPGHAWLAGFALGFGFLVLTGLLA